MPSVETQQELITALSKLQKERDNVVFVPVETIQEYAKKWGCTFENACNSIATELGGQGLTMATGRL
jgi:archaellum biogenesis protein FlaJ (TadC family)